MHLLRIDGWLYLMYTYLQFMTLTIPLFEFSRFAVFLMMMIIFRLTLSVLLVDGMRTVASTELLLDDTEGAVGRKCCSFSKTGSEVRGGGGERGQKY